jgi:hypothetical protein
MGKYSVILVQSTNQAMRIEHILNMENIPSKLIPVPRYLSSNCGNCLRILSADKEKTSKVIEKNQLEVDGIVEHED